MVKIRGVNEVFENLEKRISYWQRFNEILTTVLRALQQKSFKEVEVSIVDLQHGKVHSTEREFREER